MVGVLDPREPGSLTVSTPRDQECPTLSLLGIPSATDVSQKCTFEPYWEP